jgi:hypothetical protein
LFFFRIIFIIESISKKIIVGRMMVKGEIAFSGGAEGVKTLYKLSGKRTMTGLRSGEYA